MVMFPHCMQVDAPMFGPVSIWPLPQVTEDLKRQWVSLHDTESCCVGARHVR